MASNSRPAVPDWFTRLLHVWRAWRICSRAGHTADMCVTCGYVGDVMLARRMGVRMIGRTGD